MARYEWKAKVVGFDPIVRTNQCRNPSFETDTTGWFSVVSTITRITSSAFAGSASLAVTSTSVNNTSGASWPSSSRPTASSGQVWTGSAYVRPLSGNERLMRVNLRFYNSGGSVVSTATGTAVTAKFNSWTRVFVMGTAPATTASVEIQIQTQRNNGVTGDTAAVDGVLLEQTDRLKPYFDGSSTGPLPNERNNVFAWTGTTNLSTSTDTCEEAEASGSATSLVDLTSVSITRGRQQVQDPFRSATATITGRTPSALPSVRVGDVIQLSAFNPSNTEIIVFYGYIADLTVNYGEVANMDTWSIYCEDALAGAGRALTSSSFSWSAGITTFEAARQACVSAGIPISDLFLTDSGSTVSAQSLGDANLLSILQTLVQTEQGRLVGLSDTAIGWLDRTALQYSDQVLFFSDVLPQPAGTTKYTNVEFRSLADSFYQSVTVEPQGLAAQTAGTGVRQYSLSSYDSSDVQANNLASYVLATLNANEAAPSVISTISELLTTDDVLLAARDAGTGERCALYLRGGVYDLFIEGVTITANPDQTRFTFNVISASTLNFFILDSSTFGVLDTNKLGF